MTPWRRLRYLGEYGAARAFMLVAQSVPLHGSVRLGEWGARRVAFWTRRKFAIAVDNIRHAFPEMSQADAEELSLRVYEHFGRVTVEVAVARRLLRDSTWRDHIIVRNEGYLRDVLAAGKGAVLVTPHLGLWDLVGVLARQWGVRLVGVYRPLKNPYMDRLVRGHQDACGQVMVAKRYALPALLRVLRQRGYIGLLPDQHAGDQGLWLPFFGRLASTTPAPAILALRTGVPIVTGYVVRLPGLYRFEMFNDEPIIARSSGSPVADVRRITLDISRRFEGYARQYPEQYLWVHRRWRTPPPEIIEKGKPDVGRAGAPD